MRVSAARTASISPRCSIWRTLSSSRPTRDSSAALTASYGLRVVMVTCCTESVRVDTSALNPLSGAMVVSGWSDELKGAYARIYVLSYAQTRIDERDDVADYV